MKCCLRGLKKRHTMGRHRYRDREGHVMMVADIRVKCLQAKKCQGLPAATSSSENSREQIVLKPREGTSPATILILDLWPPELRENTFPLF